MSSQQGQDAAHFVYSGSKMIRPPVEKCCAYTHDFTERERERESRFITKYYFSETSSLLNFFASDLFCRLLKYRTNTYHNYALIIYNMTDECPPSSLLRITHFHVCICGVIEQTFTSPKRNYLDRSEFILFFCAKNPVQTDKKWIYIVKSSKANTEIVTWILSSIITQIRRGCF